MVLTGLMYNNSSIFIGRATVFRPIFAAARLALVYHDVYDRCNRVGQMSKWWYYAFLFVLAFSAGLRLGHPSRKSIVRPAAAPRPEVHAWHALSSMSSLTSEHHRSVLMMRQDAPHSVLQSQAPPSEESIAASTRSAEDAAQAAANVAAAN